MRFAAPLGMLLGCARQHDMIAAVTGIRWHSWDDSIGPAGPTGSWGSFGDYRRERRRAAGSAEQGVQAAKRREQLSMDVGHLRECTAAAKLQLNRAVHSQIWNDWRFEKHLLPQ